MLSAIRLTQLSDIIVATQFRFDRNSLLSCDPICVSMNPTASPAEPAYGRSSGSKLTGRGAHVGSALDGATDAMLRTGLPSSAVWCQCTFGGSKHFHMGGRATVCSLSNGSPTGLELMARILIVDDHPIARLGLRYMLESPKARHEVGEADNAHDALTLLREQSWDLMTLDLSLEGRSGIELLKQVRRECPQLPVLVVSMHEEERYGVRALRAGAHGYLTKGAGPKKLLEAVERLMQGRTYISEHLADLLVRDVAPESGPAHRGLSDREYEILQLLASGMRVSDIAQQLTLSVNTVSTYRTRILRKLNLRHTAELTRFAIENDLIDRSLM